VVIAISVLWCVGHQDRKEKEALLEKYTQEFLDKQNNIEAVAIKGLQNDERVATPIEKVPALTISTSTASSTEQLRNYAIAVAKALKPLNLERESEPKAVIDTIDNNNSALLKPILESKVYHQTASNNLAQIVVPEEMLTQHKKMISDLNFFVSLLTNMSKALEQPQSALNNSKSFMTNYSDFLYTIASLDQYFTDKNIQLDPQDRIQIFVSFTQ